MAQTPVEKIGPYAYAGGYKKIQRSPHKKDNAVLIDTQWKTTQLDSWRGQTFHGTTTCPVSTTASTAWGPLGPVRELTDLLITAHTTDLGQDRSLTS